MYFTMCKILKCVKKKPCNDTSKLGNHENGSSSLSV